MKILDKIIQLIMIVSTIVLSITTFYQVIMRFILKLPVPWGQDVIRLSFIWLCLTGGAYCLKTGDHLNIDLIFSFISEKKQKILYILINLVLMIFFIFLIVYGVQFTLTGTTQKAPYTNWPMYIYYTAIPFNAIYLIMYNIQNIFKLLKDLKEEDNK